jgi:hypothetical protein
MSEQNNQNPIDQQSSVRDFSGEENKNRRNWWIEIVSMVTVGYLLFSLISPMFLQQWQQPLGASKEQKLLRKLQNLSRLLCPKLLTTFSNFAMTTL